MYRISKGTLLLSNNSLGLVIVIIQTWWWANKTKSGQIYKIGRSIRTILKLHQLTIPTPTAGMTLLWDSRYKTITMAQKHCLIMRLAIPFQSLDFLSYLKILLKISQFHSLLLCTNRTLSKETKLWEMTVFLCQVHNFLRLLL